METLNGRKTIQKIAADHAMDQRKAAHLSVRPIQVSQWKRQLLDGASELVTPVKKSRDKEEVQARRLSCSSRSAGCR